MIYQLTFFQALALLSVFMIIKLNAADDVHYSHFLKTKHTKPEEVKKKKSLTNDSNAFLNFRSKNRPINLNREQQIQMEIGIGHNNHEKLVPLIDQRNKDEEHANRAMIVGMLLRKDDHKYGQPLMMWAHQQRLRAQETQLQINKIQSEGHIITHSEQQVGEKKRKRAEEEDGTALRLDRQPHHPPMSHTRDEYKKRKDKRNAKPRNN